MPDICVSDLGPDISPIISFWISVADDPVFRIQTNLQRIRILLESDQILKNFRFSFVIFISFEVDTRFFFEVHIIY